MRYMDRLYNLSSKISKSYIELRDLDNGEDVLITEAIESINKALIILAEPFALEYLKR